MEELAPDWVARIAFLRRRLQSLEVDVSMTHTAIAEAMQQRCPLGNMVESWRCYLDAKHAGTCQPQSITGFEMG